MPVQRDMIEINIVEEEAMPGPAPCLPLQQGPGGEYFRLGTIWSLAGPVNLGETGPTPNIAVTVYDGQKHCTDYVRLSNPHATTVILPLLAAAYSSGNPVKVFFDQEKPGRSITWVQLEPRRKPRSGNRARARGVLTDR